MALLHFPILNSSVDQECENITFKVSWRAKILRTIFLFLSTGGTDLLQGQINKSHKTVLLMKQMLSASNNYFSNTSGVYGN